MNAELMKAAGCADLPCDVKSSAQKQLSYFNGGITGSEAPPDQVRSLVEEGTGKPLGHRHIEGCDIRIARASRFQADAFCYHRDEQAVGPRRVERLRDVLRQDFDPRAAWRFDHAGVILKADRIGRRNQHLDELMPRIRKARVM